MMPERTLDELECIREHMLEEADDLREEIEQGIRSTVRAP